MRSTDNRRIVLASRPKGAPTPENFRFETVATPALGEGEVLVRNQFLSLDPYMRGRMSDAKSYAQPIAIDAVMGAGTVGRVVASKDKNFAEGDAVLAFGGWQDYAVVEAKDLAKLPAGLDHPSYALSILGMPGFTAWHGLLKIGEPKPNETVVVAAASGPVGSIVGQIAKLKGARVIGIAGGPDKCRTVVEDFGFDACLDRKAADFAEQLKKAVPDGIDVYFENVGGQVFDAVLPLLNVHARVPVCGLIASYNATSLPDGPDRLPLLAGTLLRQRIRMQGFIISDHYGDEFADFQRDMSSWVAAGKVKIIEDVVEGLKNAPDAFIGLLEGQNFGKLVVKIAD
ncbi:NADP-dependent oxidoreductase [Jiella sp. MQZ9-1]|uniref:NADP-dependent oxidoreductase n=1 Tax=Jiella flava TaxID=2816857 RepID=A0A939G3C5_9HYPH|nr:NADP-dependent oxidoreductase [Jiella flava]MBO0664487.1 NADP-dependent oxidoreductase [Jiella flava]MCD2473123.1 NADP-dependent oxidoreductase [Jiella flava]